jgi:hypothetical protein
MEKVKEGSLKILCYQVVIMEVSYICRTLFSLAKSYLLNRHSELWVHIYAVRAAQRWRIRYCIKCTSVFLKNVGKLL